MKKSILALSLLAVASSGYAANVVNFYGEVADQTCTLTIDGNDFGPSILLDTALASDLATAGSTAKKTQFEVKVFGCDTAPTTGQAGIRLVPNGLITAAGNLPNVITGASAATNVELQMLDDTDTAINFSGGGLSITKPWPTGTTDITFTMGVQYYATGIATAGLLRSNVQYAVTYQ